MKELRDLRDLTIHDVQPISDRTKSMVFDLLCKKKKSLKVDLCSDNGTFVLQPFLSARRIRLAAGVNLRSENQRVGFSVRVAGEERVNLLITRPA